MQVTFIFSDKILGADFTDMRLTNKSNKGAGLFKCIIDICSKTSGLFFEGQKNNYNHQRISNIFWMSLVVYQTKYG